jgi:hypothetical protein
VSVVEVKDVEIPADMQRAMARQAEGRARAAREGHLRRGRVPGVGAAQGRRGVMAQQPITVQLPVPADTARDRAANNSTIVFPIPIDLLTALSNAADAGGDQS